MVYLAITVFCIIFNQIYALFGHGVHSPFMTLMFLFPLLGGVLPFLILSLFVNDPYEIKGYRFSYNCYNSGIAALTSASLLHGIFEIAGTDSPYLAPVTFTGWSMVSAAVLLYLIRIIGRRHKKEVIS